MRVFHLLRANDPTGISGTGCVAEGVVFSSGWVAMTWLSDTPTITFYGSVEQLEAIHGHQGTTRLVFDEHDCSLLGQDASGRDVGGRLLSTALDLPWAKAPHP